MRCMYMMLCIVKDVDALDVIEIMNQVTLEFEVYTTADWKYLRTTY